MLRGEESWLTVGRHVGCVAYNVDEHSPNGQWRKVDVARERFQVVVVRHAWRGCVIPSQVLLPVNSYGIALAPLLSHMISADQAYRGASAFCIFQIWWVWIVSVQTNALGFLEGAGNAAHGLSRVESAEHFPSASPSALQLPIGRQCNSPCMHMRLHLHRRRGPQDFDGLLMHLQKPDLEFSTERGNCPDRQEKV